MQSTTLKHMSFLILSCSYFVAMLAQSSGVSDPYLPVRYSNAFNQIDLWKEHRLMMEHLGCVGNLFEQTGNQDIVFSDAATSSGPLADVLSEFECYQKACVKKLNNARRFALAEPGMYAVAQMGAMLVGAALVIKLFGTDSGGGSFSGFVAIFESLEHLLGAIQAGYNLYSWPDNPLEYLEELFAKNKCFIPKALWPKIVRELVYARQNELSRENHTSFLNFALGFTTYKPQSPLLSKEGYSQEGIKAELSKRIYDFFAHYAKESCSPAEIYKIILNVTKFVDQLYDRNARSAPRYVYLYGPGGVGKTHFVEQLSRWIAELLPESVNFEALIINTQSELEGTSERPGALLKVFYNQLVQNKRGSIVVLDEATWLNEPSMLSAAKRTFNGDQSKLSTSYFGSGSDGGEISLDTPPMLVFVASNDFIADAALASRFDTVNFPTPSKESLVSYAVRVLQSSAAMRSAKAVPDTAKIKAWIEALDHTQLNFRFIAGSVEAEFLAQLL